MSSSEGTVTGKPPIGTPGKTPSTTPRSTVSTLRQTQAQGRTANNARPSASGQASKPGRQSSVTSETEATLRRKIERLKLELDTKKTKTKRGYSEGKSLVNRSTSKPTPKSNSGNVLSKSLSIESTSSGSKDTTKVQTPPNSQSKSTTARRSTDGVPDARLTKTLPTWRSGGSGDPKATRPSPTPAPRGLTRGNSKPDLLKRSNSKSDLQTSSSTTNLKRKDTFVVKKTQSGVSTRIPTIRASPKAEITKTAVGNTLSKQSIPINTSVDDPEGNILQASSGNSMENIHTRVSKIEIQSVRLDDEDNKMEDEDEIDFPQEENDAVGEQPEQWAKARDEVTLDHKEDALSEDIGSLKNEALVETKKDAILEAGLTISEDLYIHDGEELLQNGDLSVEGIPERVEMNSVDGCAEKPITEVS